MKATIIVVLIFFVLVNYSCNKDYTNPYDSACPSNIWTPTNLSTTFSQNAIVIKWEESDTHFDGFVLEKGSDSINWTSTSTGLIDKTLRTYTDSIFTPGSNVYYRISAKADLNKSGITYSKGLKLPIFMPAITTAAISNVLSTSATSGGTISSNGGAAVTASGVCWSINQNPTILNSYSTDGSATGTFASLITGLTPGTVYYVRAYATNSAGTAYGNQITVKSTVSLSTITTTPISNILSTSASTGGTISSNGGAAVTASGVCWSTTENPTILNSFSTDGSATGTFTSLITGLAPGTVYFVRAYATNSAGTAYGNQVSIKSMAGIPTITTTAISNILPTSASSGGTISTDGGAPVTASGVCWSTTENPTILNSFSTDGSATGTFTSTITGLTPGTSYYVRAYATNSAGTAYGNQVTVKSVVSLPTITTTAISNILPTSASSGGIITSNGGAAVTASGVCWSTTENPTILNSYSTDGSATGTFTSALTGLSPVMVYYVRAYATNSAGTSYGNQVTFTTTASLSNITTSTVTGVTITSATGGGTIFSNGGAVVTASGVCWSSNPNPTILNSYSTDGSATGTYSSAITGLSPGTVYYVRAYATNSAGTAYGNQVTFTTNASLSVLTTLPATGISFTSASCGGTISSNGGSAVTSSGICWSTIPNPTILNSYSTDGSANGTFTSAMTGLSPGTVYYVRAYATNTAGTAYGNQVTFMTTASVSMILTAPSTDITFAYASGLGIILSRALD